MMTKSGFFIFVLLVLTAMGFFVKLAIETLKEEEGTQEKREASMEHYVEKGLE